MSPQSRLTDCGDVTPPCEIVNVVMPGIVHWKVAMADFVVARVSASSVTVTVAPDTVKTSPLDGVTRAPAKNEPIAGLADSTALPEPAGVSSVYIPVTTVVPWSGSTVRVNVGAPSGVASVFFGSEIRVTPKAKIAT